MDSTPIELRINKHPNGGYTFYTVDKVYPGIANVVFGQRKFMTYKDVQAYCATGWPKVPLLKNW